jgi:aminomuconate-semialdehyde/2-hydroxymuconate-6-semialdehyde dehydrogenase
VLTIGHLIDGETVPARDGATFESVNPATRRVHAIVARGSVVDADRAVQAARRAFDEGPWPRMTPDERATVLHRVADLLLEHADELAALDTADMGKPITQSRTLDMPRAAHNFRFFADYARFAADEALPIDAAHHCYTRREPVGVTAAISPWNFPLMLATWKIAPALAFGNTVVLKPAEQAPASCTRVAELALEAGLPSGVLNVVHGFGPGEVGEGLTTHLGVDLVTFTGESSTGRAILAAVAPSLKRVSFELGGKAATVVFADSNLDDAVRVAALAAFVNAGQVCLAGSRIYAQRAIYEDLVARLMQAAEGMRLGDPTDAATQVGPLSSEEHHAKVVGHLEEAEAEGAKVCTGGPADGWWVRPTVLTNVHRDMRVCRDEVFGPVVTVEPFDDEAEAVTRANDTPYGLNAMVFTEDLGRAHRMAASLEAGTIWVNCFNVRDLRAPFGGFKDSGIGREGGEHSREFFTEAKAVVMRLPGSHETGGST